MCLKRTPEDFHKIKSLWNRKLFKRKQRRKVDKLTLVKNLCIIKEKQDKYGGQHPKLSVPPEIIK